MKLKLLYGITLLTFYTSFAQNPGGIKGAEIWYKSEKENIQNGIYKDYSRKNHIIKNKDSVNRPSLSWFNFNESLNFNGKDNYLSVPFTMEDLNNLVIFTVIKDMDTEKERNLYQSKNGYKKEISFSNKNILYSGDKLNYLQSAPKIPFLNTYVHYGIPAKSINSIIGGKDKSILYVGKKQDSLKYEAFKGKIPEFILFKKQLTHSEIQRIESYLALKYGITLPENQSYLSSRNIVLWDKDNNLKYGHNIAGIGKDNQSSLHQKQSTSSNENQNLIISTGELKAENSLNTHTLNNQDFLIWGDNGSPLHFTKDGAKDNIHFIQRKWRMQASGKTSNEISTHLYFQTQDYLNNQPLSENETLWLFINPDNNEVFEGNKVIKKDIDSIDSLGRAVFSDIKWPKNKSVFSIGKGPYILMDLSVTDPTCKRPSGATSVNIYGGKSPYKISLKGMNNNSSQNFSLKDTEFNISELQPDEYELIVTDKQQKIQQKKFNISYQGDIQTNLKKEWTLQEGQSITLDASANVKDKSASYYWRASNGFISTDPKIAITQPGLYEVSVTSQEGCTITDKIMVNAAYDDYGIFIVPNPAKLSEGIHIISKLRKSEEIMVKVFDLSGKLIASKKQAKNTSHDFLIQVPEIGAYQVIAQAGEEKISLKVLVDNK